MAHEIVTHILTIQQLKNEISFLVEYFEDKKIGTCQVLFGYPWGLEYYGENDWAEESIPTTGLIEKILAVENSKIGAIGNDDLFLTFGAMKFTFCHESDIHLNFENSNEDTEFLYERWASLGFKPREWVQANDSSKKIQLR